MTSGLRKAHKIIWLVLGILGVVLIVLSVKSVKQSLDIDRDISVIKKPTTEHTITDNADWYIAVEELTDTNVIQIVVKRPLKSASTGVYEMSSNQERGAFIGTMDKKGLYTFKLDKTVKKIQLFDAIKNDVIQNIDLSWD